MRPFRWNRAVPLLSALALLTTGCSDKQPTSAKPIQIELSATTLELSLGETLEITARVLEGSTPTDEQVQRTSSDPKVASVTKTGEGNAVGVGQSVLSASVADVQASVQVAVVPGAVKEMTAFPADLKLTAVGAEQKLSASAQNEFGVELSTQSVRWSSLAPEVATVDSGGTVHAVAKGSTSVIASLGGVFDTVAVVIDPVVATVELFPTLSGVAKDQTAQLTATGKDSLGTPVNDVAFTWASIDPAIATVSTTGLVIGKVLGNTSVIASFDGMSDTVAMEVVAEPVASVAVTPSTATVEATKTVTLTATAKGASGNVLANRTVSWSSSDTDVARVGAAGIVTGVKTGTATVKATVEGRMASATVTVTARSSWMRNWTTGVSRLPPGASQANGAAEAGGAVVVAPFDFSRAMPSERVAPWSQVSSPEIVLGVSYSFCTGSETKRELSGQRMFLGSARRRVVPSFYHGRASPEMIRSR